VSVVRLLINQEQRPVRQIPPIFFLAKAQFLEHGHVVDAADDLRIYSVTHAFLPKTETATAGCAGVAVFHLI
jgi:hypothetical protein